MVPKSATPVNGCGIVYYIQPISHLKNSLISDDGHGDNFSIDCKVESDLYLDKTKEKEGEYHQRKERKTSANMIESQNNFSMHLGNRQTSIAKLRHLAFEILGDEVMGMLQNKPPLYSYTQSRGSFNGNATKNSQGNTNSNMSNTNVFAFQIDRSSTEQNEYAVEDNDSDVTNNIDVNINQLSNIIGETSLAITKVPLGYLNRAKRDDIIFKSSSNFKNSKEILQEAYYSTLSKAKEGRQ